VHGVRACARASMCLCTFKQDYESLSPTQHGSTGLSKKEIKPAGAGGERGGAGGGAEGNISVNAVVGT